MAENKVNVEQLEAQLAALEGKKIYISAGAEMAWSFSFVGILRVVNKDPEIFFKVVDESSKNQLTMRFSAYGISNFFPDNKEVPEKPYPLIYLKTEKQMEREMEEEAEKEMDELIDSIMEDEEDFDFWEEDDDDNYC